MICNNNCNKSKNKNMLNNNCFELCCNNTSNNNNNNILWLKLTMTLPKKRLYNNIYIQNNNLFFINNTQSVNDIDNDNNIKNENEKRISENKLDNEECFYIYINLNSVSQIKNVKGDGLYIKIVNENNYMIFYYEDIKSIEIVNLENLINEFKI